IWRIASAMACPCETRTSTCRSFATISSGLYRFLAITVLLDVKRHTSSRTTSMGADQWDRHRCRYTRQLRAKKLKGIKNNKKKRRSEQDGEKRVHTGGKRRTELRFHGKSPL